MTEKIRPTGKPSAFLFKWAEEQNFPSALVVVLLWGVETALPLPAVYTIVLRGLKSVYRLLPSSLSDGVKKTF